MEQSWSASSTFTEAVCRHQSGDLDGAEALYRRILEGNPAHAEATHLLGVVEYQRGRPNDAAQWIVRALALEPSRPDFLNSLGVVYRVLGQLEESAGLHRQALGHWADYPDALANLGVVLHELGRSDEARSALEAAIRLAPTHVNALAGLANLLQDQGEAGPAVPLYRQALELAPGRGEILENLALALAASGSGEAGLAEVQRWYAASPPGLAMEVARGRALERWGRVEEAATVWRSVARSRPAEGHWGVRAAALCPAVFDSTEEIDRYRAELKAALDAQAEGLRLAIGEVAGSGCLPSFHLAHHGRDDRDLRSKFAGLFRKTFAAGEPVGGEGPPHLGFVVARGGAGGFARGMAGIVNRLDPEFRVTVFGPPGDSRLLRQAISRAGVEFVALPGDLVGAAVRVAAARCDVLDHWQVDLDPIGYFLPFTRSAAVQCTSWGTHATSGITALDYYRSGAGIEAEGAEAFYTEELVRLATLPTYQEPIVPPDPPPRRAEFGLPEDRTLYACLQRSAKLHPDFDAVLGAILRADRLGLLLLLEDEVPAVTARLRARLGRNLADVIDRVIFVSRRTRSAYLRLLSVVDVALDPPMYGSGLTCYDILGQGVPLVTRPGRLQVGRYAAGCYAKLGLHDFISSSLDHYVDRAVRLGRDQDLGHTESGRILATVGELFEDSLAVVEHDRFFRRAVERSRREVGGERRDMRAAT